mmetsp:Transcript_76312/g.220481  ORF Transcript_76312/g.220481 Transcript_76312/m.220481 type:complete len:244 (+) Transcript_76312:845-1576(+)
MPLVEARRAVRHVRGDRLDRVPGDPGPEDAHRDHVHALPPQQVHAQDPRAAVENHPRPAETGGCAAGRARELLVRRGPLHRRVEARTYLELIHHAGVQPAWRLPAAALPRRGVARAAHRRLVPGVPGLAGEVARRDCALLEGGQPLVHELRPAPAVGAHGGKGCREARGLLHELEVRHLRRGPRHAQRLPHGAPGAVHPEGAAAGPGRAPRQEDRAADRDAPAGRDAARGGRGGPDARRQLPG